MTTILRKILTDLPKGTAEPRTFTPEAWRLLQDGLQHDAAYRALGPIQGIELLEHHAYPDAGLRTYRFRVVYERDNLLVALALNGAGAVSSMSVRAE